MSGTIIRAAEALRAAGQTALADELTDMLQRTVANIDTLLKRVDKSQALIKKYINGVQARCEHSAWHLDPPDSIACCNCGHTVCEPKVHAWAERVVKTHPDSYGWLARFKMRGSRFRLDKQCRELLGDKLIVKEIKDEETTEAHPS